MKNYTMYLLSASTVFCLACGNSEQKKEAAADTTVQTADTTISSTENAVKLDTTDVSFFENAAYGGMIEVESSEKILQTTQDGAVKIFAQMMVNDHGSTNEQLKSLAERKGYLLPIALPNSKLNQISTMDKLKNEGKDEYYIQLMNAEHQNAINIFSLASRSKDKEIASFSSKVLPTLKQHHQQVLKIDTLLKAPKANQGDDPVKISDRKKQ